ncbi:SecD/SecF fusion protein [Pullulanibacillus pueri]|uniref:Protein-export membrane protein SecF n=1 Tax=Pullulanibacillus pueri TaxID=1437324 RepID=A0A8J2ZYB3_9BACL|nr:SecD/SecF fusion protein [Pullulanibacillus pueri]GGH85774.1 hypothetical protein GCM10007096_31940 [Pullulanibacillus pueri]
MSFKKLNYMKYRKLFFTVSTILVILGIVSLFIFKMNLGIDFSSGTRVDIQGKHALSIDKLTDTVESLGYEAERPTLAGNNNNFASVTLNKVLNQDQINQLQQKIQKDMGYKPTVSTVSPAVGRELAKNAFWAVIISSIFIIIYVWIRFEFLQGLTAVIALLHDAFFIITIFSLLHIEVNAVFIAALLTIIGYSINDTIVTFDRVRENVKLKKGKLTSFEDYKEIVNKSIQQTIVRSINTVLTVLIPVIALLIFGSPSIRTFTIAMFIGLIAGVYSSIFIAAPLWAVMKFKHDQRQKKKKVRPQQS